MRPKRVTSQDVARKAGVSRTTVSFVLNRFTRSNISPETVERVWEAARELGYVPNAAAQARVRQRSQNVALILSRDAVNIISDIFLNKIIQGLLVDFHQHGLSLILDVVEDFKQKDTYLNLVLGKRIDGIILSGPRFDDEALRILAEDHFPTVLMGSLPDSGICSVDVDNVLAARKAVDHLLNLGHKRIACITNAPPNFTAAIDRLRGYRLALEEKGIPYTEELVRFGNFDPGSGYAQMESILELKERPTAVFVASDVVAFGALSAIQHHGLSIPGDIAMIGFDDVPMANYVTPPLTTIRLPSQELARSASDLLIKQIKGELIEPCQILLDTEMVVRKSCGMKGG